MQKKVVVIGHGYTSRLAIIRSAGMAGYDVDVVVIYYGKKARVKKPLDCYSKYVNTVLYSPAGNESALVDLLVQNYLNVENKPILIPESDFSVKVVDLNFNRLKDYFLIPNIDNRQGAVVEWMDKQKQKQRATELGLNVASCSIISIRNGSYEIPYDIHYPCFPKPVDGGKSALGRCDDVFALRNSLDCMAAVRDMDVMVEEFLNIDKEYAILGFSDGMSVVIPAVVYIEKMANGSHFGVAKNGKVLPVKGFELVLEQFKSLIKSIGFVGLFDIDFLECQGKFYFDEINLRFGGSGYAVTKAGANLPAMMADYFTIGNYKRQEYDIQNSVTFVNERTCLDDWYGGFVTYKEFQNELSMKCIHFVQDDTDVQPYRAFKKYLLMGIFKKCVKTIVKKK